MKPEVRGSNPSSRQTVTFSCTLRVLLTTAVHFCILSHYHDNGCIEFDATEQRAAHTSIATNYSELQHARRTLRHVFVLRAAAESVSQRRVEEDFLKAAREGDVGLVSALVSPSRPISSDTVKPSACVEICFWAQRLGLCDPHHGPSSPALSRMIQFLVRRVAMHCGSCLYFQLKNSTEISINCTDKFGNTALHTAAYRSGQTTRYSTNTL